MVELLKHGTILSYMEKYFDSLSATGFVGEGSRKRHLRLMLISDLIEDFYDFITEADYRKLNDALLRITGSGDCLLPYPKFCQRCSKLGKPRYIATGKFRITEVDGTLRITENEKLRGV